MAISGNPLLAGVSGALGKQLIIKKYYDKIVLSAMPDMSKRVLSKKQEEANQRFALANHYAAGIYQSEEKRMQARIRLNLPAHKSLYHALVKEFLDAAVKR